jgi:hypothetical protein
VIWWLYNLVFPLAFACLLPHFLLRMARRGGYARGFAQRWGRYAPAEAALLAAPGRPIWIQAVSVGSWGWRSPSWTNCAAATRPSASSSRPTPPRGGNWP